MKKRMVCLFEGKDFRICLFCSFFLYINDFCSKELKQYDLGDVRIFNEEYFCLSLMVMMRLFELVFKVMKDYLRVFFSKF